MRRPPGNRTLGAGDTVPDEATGLGVEEAGDAALVKVVVDVLANGDGGGDPAQVAAVRTRVAKAIAARGMDVGRGERLFGICAP
jgi:hypothetical protein